MQASLLPRLARGDTTAVDLCIERYGGLIWSLARRLSPTVADAEDAVQEIFLDLWRTADRYRDEKGGEATFVAMIARRRLIDRLRKFRRESESLPIDDSPNDLAVAAEDPAVEIAEEGSRATACLERLRTDERRVLELSIYQGLPQTQIAEQIGIPLGTVKTHARRGLSQLRDCMQARSRMRSKGVEAL